MTLFLVSSRWAILALLRRGESRSTPPGRFTRRRFRQVSIILKKCLPTKRCPTIRPCTANATRNGKCWQRLGNNSERKQFRTETIPRSPVRNCFRTARKCYRTVRKQFRKVTELFPNRQMPLKARQKRLERVFLQALRV